MVLPVASVVMPADLAGQTNGKLDPALLVTVATRGALHHIAARAWLALVGAAQSEASMPLTYIYGGMYRDYKGQEALFRSRYSPDGTGGGCKTWNGVRWCKKSPNLATAAVPGTSNHGWGLAIDSAFDNDLSDGVGPDDATSISSHPGWKWLLANADRFGFSWEIQSEPWHIRYVTGDTIPQAVLDFEGSAPPPPATTDEVDMIAIDYKPNTPEWTAMTWTGVELSHVVNGHADAVIRRAGVQRLVVNDVELDGIISSSTTKTDCPPAWANTSRGATWAANRG